ncbi:MAG: 50S ribosomal protein L16 [Candidatus Woykebacteria bacterium RBG_16_44_10]|uniref:Large ribosomal subunit protein uL16 n=1 Tax=Candidatus Woykebacteria bacterium RBG_16_44_10 TaxID=1802597 RepID=A0A1G1WE82_9BACT|nr:MAG: 50S ribosomal protein L16 [Candidatus Woykebacteria bacterium RBG_16_44_10]
MLQPKRVKYRRAFRGRRAGQASRGSAIEFGEYALKALRSCWLSARQIEAARRTIAHYTKRSGRIWIRVFPDKPVSKKPAETRMGSGKGAVDHYVAVVKPGTVLFEMGGVEKDVATEAMKRAAAKLPIETRFISLEE